MRSADALRAEAEGLVQLQREHRGWTRGKDLDDKPCLIPGPYVATPETEARAAQILRLRKQAAAMEAKR